ncbi:putative ribonuclease H-like domain-containing protein [Tanacetum coccineum]
MLSMTKFCIFIRHGTLLILIEGVISLEKVLFYPYQPEIIIPWVEDREVYSLDLKNIVPSGGITCLYANATTDESKLWHRRLGHVNFKNINKLVKGHLVRGLPSKVFVNDHTCVACKKGKQHKASCKAKLERTIRKPLELLHMDLFGPVSVESINKKKYCLVVTDDFSRFSWVFFLATKDETNEILYKFITGLENQLNHKVKIIRSDHGTEFKNHAMNELCAKKGIKREFSVARTPQQNGVAERKNRTLIEAARTMLADSLLPIPFWAEAVNTACYVLNRVLVTKPQNKTPYELLIGKPPSISFMRPFGCPLTILNTLDPLGKFDGKSDEGYLLGYSTTSKAFRVYNKRTKRVEENLHIDFLEYQPNVAGSGPDWMFDLDFLTNTMNYIPVSVENQITVDAGTQESYVADAQEKSFENAPNDKGELDLEDIAAEQALKDDLERMVAQEMATQAVDDATRQAFEEEKRKSASIKRAAQATSINKLNTGRPSVNTANTPYVSAASTPTGANAGKSSFVDLGRQIPIDASTLPNADINMHDLEDVSNAFPNDGIFSGAYDDDDVGAEADFKNMDNTIDVSPIPTLRVHKDHPKGQILRDPKSAVQTRGKIQKASSVQQALNISQALQDESWVEAMQEKLLQFKLQKVWVLVDLPYGKKTEMYRLWMMFFAPVSRIEAIRLFLAFASYMGFTVYQMDVKSAFLYGTIEEEVYVHQPPGFVDPAHPNKVYKVIKALYGLHQAPRAWYETLSSFLMENGFRRGTIDKTLFIKKKKSDIMLVQVYVDDIIFGSTKKSMCTEFEDCMHKRFQMSSMGELTFFLGLQVKQQPDGIFISQDKYVADILKKFDFWSIRTATTPIESNKPLVKDEDGVDVDVHVYRSMIGSLMYLTASRPDIMFAVCLWYPRDSPFELEAYSDSDYGGASLDRKSTTGGCQFLGRRLISWQCKKQTIMANSTTGVRNMSYLGFRESLERDIDGTEELLSRHAHSLVVKISTTFVEQFWMCAKSKIINNVRYITAKVAGKPVTILEASIKSDLLFDDADGIDSMHNQAIFDAIQLMGLKNVPVPLDHFPINALTSKVFSFMVKKGKHFSGNVTPLFESMLVQPTEDEGEALERQSEPQPTPSPPHPSADQHETQPDPSPRPLPTIPIPDSIPEGSGGNHGDQAKEIKHLKAHIKKLKKKAKPVITHHKAWMKSVSMKQRLAGKKSLKKKWMQKEYVSKQGRKPAKAGPTVHKDLTFDDLDNIVDDATDYMESEDAQDEGRNSALVML